MYYFAFLQNLQMPELIIIFIAALLIFGPKNLPKLGRSLGQMTREFKDATNKITESLSDLDKEPPPRPARRQEVERTPTTELEIESPVEAPAEKVASTDSQ